MGNSSEHVSVGYAAPKWQWGVFLLASAMFWLLPLMVFVNLPRGLDLADTGHYYNTLSQFEDIRSLSSHYFLLWDMLPIGEGIHENRLWVFGLFFIVGGIFSTGIARFLRLKPFSNPTDFLAVAFMWSNVYLYYFWWLPDPSYNAVAVILLYGLAGLVMGLTTLKHGLLLLVLSGITGFLLAAFAMTRPSSAIVFLILAAIFFIWHASPLLSQRTGLIMGAGLAGGVLFLLLAHILVEPFNVTLERQLGGLEMRQIRGRNKSPVVSITRFLSDAGKDIVFYWPFVVAIIGGAVPVVSGLARTRHIKRIFMLLSAAGFIGIAIKFAMFFREGKFARDVEISGYLLVLVLCLLMIFTVQKIFAKAKTGRPTLSVILWLLVLPYCYVLGTGNLWMKQSLLAGGFLVSAGMIIVLADRQKPVFWTACALAAMLMVPFGVHTTLQNKPYRLQTSLADQTIPVTIRNGAGGMLFVDGVTAKYLNDFASFYEELGPEDSRAHLIDMSGMSPFLHYHLDVKLMTVPWLIATEKNSQATFEFILARMDVAALRSAWIIDAPDNRRHLDGAALRAIGLNFPDDYELVLTSRPPLSKKDIHLYRPKAITTP